MSQGLSRMPKPMEPQVSLVRQPVQVILKVERLEQVEHHKSGTHLSYIGIHSLKKPKPKTSVEALSAKEYSAS